jgi:tetratricopeptide (TPR) repeat protein
MRLKSLPVLLFVASIALLTSLAQVKAPENPPAAPQDYSKEAYIVERSHTRVTAEADGRGTRELTGEVKILADAGVKEFALLNFTYTSANEVVDVDYVRVRKPDGTVISTPDYNIQDMPADITRAAPVYSDIHEKHVAVKGLGVGDVLEYQIRYRVLKPQIPGHFWFEYSFTKSAIIKYEQLEISVPKEKYVKVVSPEVKPEVKDEGARRVYRWTASNLKRQEKDPAEIPKRTAPDPSVQITTFASWEDVGRWYGGLQKDPLQVTPAIQAKAAELTKGLSTDEEKIRAIYNYVSLRFHYIGLSFGIGRYQPHAADDVLGNEYGDCKDKHILLASLLKAAGYDGWPALIHSTRKLNADVPSPAQFDHLITVVPSGGKLTWLDTTAEVAPYGLLMTVLRDKQALVIPSDKAPMLVKTPADPPFPQEQRFSAEGKLLSNGTFTGHVEQTYRGDLEVVLRTAFRQVPQAQWKELAQGFSQRLGFGGDVSNVQATPPEETEKPFHVSYDYLRKNYSAWESKQITPPLPPIGLEATNQPNETKPSEPIFLGALGEIVYLSKVTLPAGYSATAPRGLDLVEPYADYHSTSTLQEGVLTTSRRLVIKKTEVAIGDWEGYRKFGKAISDDEFTFIQLSGSGEGASGSGANVAELDRKFREGYDALQRRDAKRAQELFEQVIAGDPKYRGAHFYLAQALWAQSKNDEALSEFHKEQEIAPDDPRAYQMAAMFATMLQRKDDAIQELRKLLKVDPKNHDAALNLSQLFSEDGKYSEAAELLESAVKSSPDSPSLQLALGKAYLKSGQTEKAIPHLREAAETHSTLKDTHAAILNSVAYTLAESSTQLDLAKQYAEQAVAELDARSRQAADSDETGMEVTYQFSLVWDTLGWVYFQMGDLSRAESYVRAAWILGQEGIVGNHLGQIYEKQGKKKEAAHTYELAFAARPTPSVGITAGPPWGFAKVYTANRDDILSRYERLTGKKPFSGTKRLPNGQWTPMPEEELRRMRETKLGNQADLLGSAEFSIVFASGKVESVRYVSGNESLKSLSEKLAGADYQVEFPSGSTAKIVRRVTVSCYLSVGCKALMLPPSRTRIGQF